MNIDKKKENVIYIDISKDYMFKKFILNKPYKHIIRGVVSMNVEITKMAKSLETVHTHTTGIYQSVFANEAKYKVETCNKTKVDFNMQKK